MSEGAEAVGPARFTVRLTNFEGPFDLLLQLIGKHKLDVTEIALSTVTDEFIAHLRALGDELDLDQASEFLVVAATLLDLKASRLLPAADVDDEEDLELLEARDLLFARLLQYKAYKLAAAFLRERESLASRRFPRAVALEARFADLVPEVRLDLTPEQFAALAARALAPRPGGRGRPSAARSRSPPGRAGARPRPSPPAWAPARGRQGRRTARG